MGDDGQVAFGDSNNFLKYYKDQNGVYRLAIFAGRIVFGASGKNVEDALKEVENVEIGARNLTPIWCPRPGSNRHGNLFPQDFKSWASANSATSA